MKRMIILIAALAALLVPAIPAHGGHLADLNRLRGQVDAPDARLDALEPRVGALQNRADAFAARLTTLEGAVDAMQHGSSTGPRRVYNIRDYGAVLTDNADDSAAVQAAANAIPTSGGTLWHPGGTAVVNSIAISGKSNVRIMGPGTYRRTPLAGNVRIFSIDGCDGLVVDGPTFDWNGNPEYGGNAITDSDRVRIRNTYSYDSALHPSWRNIDHYAWVIQRGEDLVFTYNTVEDAELLELNLWEGGTVAHNASRRAAGTAALGSFGVGDGYHLRDLDFVGNKIIDPRRLGLVIQNEGGGLSGFKVERIRIAQNTIAHTSTTADPSSYLLNIGVFTGATSGTGNVRRDIEIEDNLFYVAPDLAPRTAPAVFLNAPEATPQPFERLEFVGNRIVGPRTGDWSVDIRGAKDATIARSQISGAVDYGMALIEPQGSRIEDNNAQGVVRKYALVDSAGGNRIAENDQLPASMAGRRVRWTPAGHVNDLINP
jgi:hypothetical protein